ncbi:hypothetical protein [Streptomyces sp. NPDC051561]|uniref:hypothetical protein n=1 Tax=Streptomyces sp. NPDC051561 TaxID=3365658 RepID=UPI0037AE35AC
MPRRQSTAAKHAREAQRRTGGKYTTLLREVATPQTPKTFPFRSLLAECSTLPAFELVHEGDYHPDDEPWPGPQVFESTLIGGPVPCGTVLALAGALSGLEMRGNLQMELYTHLSSATVVCEGRRFELILNQDLLYELCRSPMCSRHPINDVFLPFCTSHLPEQDPEELTDMARDWGLTRREVHTGQAEATHAALEGDLLIKAAVAQGAATEVMAAIIDYCFIDPDLLDECFPQEEALAVRHAIEREQLRLTTVAIQEATRIRNSVDNSCEACSKHLWDSPAMRPVPPQFCSASCAPPRTPRRQRLSVWAAKQ